MNGTDIDEWLGRGTGHLIEKYCNIKIHTWIYVVCKVKKRLIKSPLEIMGSGNKEGRGTIELDDACVLMKWRVIIKLDEGYLLMYSRVNKTKKAEAEVEYIIHKKRKDKIEW